MVQIKIRGVDVDFPFPPYDCQVSYMEKVIHCLQEVRNRQAQRSEKFIGPMIQERGFW